MSSNYQKEMDTILNSLPGDSLPRLLLHSCCGPCSSYVLRLLLPYFDITVLFYNPNIQPEEEYIKRKASQTLLLDFLKAEGNNIALMDCDYQPESFEAFTAPLADEPEGGVRCEACFRLRLNYTAERAKEQEFDYFCTTLSVSPHKDAHLLNQLGRELQMLHGVHFLCADFKKKNGYKQSVTYSKLYGLYRQEYCGCKYSQPTIDKK